MNSKSFYQGGRGEDFSLSIDLAVRKGGEIRFFFIFYFHLLILGEDLEKGNNQGREKSPNTYSETDCQKKNDAAEVKFSTDIFFFLFSFQQKILTELLFSLPLWSDTVYPRTIKR